MNYRYFLKVWIVKSNPILMAGQIWLRRELALDLHAKRRRLVDSGGGYPNYCATIALGGLRR